MLTFLRANIASLIASVTDYLLMVCLVEFFAVNQVVAGIVGTVCGGVVNFFIGRTWVFKAEQKKITAQATKYLLVWSGNLILNAGGLYLMIDVTGVHYAISKIIVSLVVAFAYNYPLQKRFVFYNN